MRASIINFLKSFDFFSVPVYLTYKGEKEFSTVQGGFCSMLLTILFLVYCGVDIKHTFNYANFDIDTS